MKIYVTHANSFDYQKELYQPIRNSVLDKKHEIILPHEKSKAQFNSKEYMKDCDLIIAEVSYASTGQGIELGWADIYKVPIVCLFKKGSRPSGAIKVVSKNLMEYKNTKDLIEKITKYLSTFNQ